MLSDLFHENEPVGNNPYFERREAGLSSKPPLPRNEYNLVGLDNQGSTCYLNSLIQQLFFTPEFLTGLFAIGPELLGVGGPEGMVRSIPLELQRLFARMLASDEVAVSTADLTRSFGWTGSEVFQQHDVQELNRILFTAIEDSLVGLPVGSDLIRRYYRGVLVNQIRCHVCGAVSEREEDYQDLCVPVAGHSDLTSSLVTAYVDTELLEGDNAYRCEMCNAYVTASKGTKIRSLPPILTISMLRFNFDFRKMERYKETRRFEFPMALDMAPFVETTPNADWPLGYVYDLVGVVIHRGSGFGGHYHAYIRDNLGLGRWSPPETAPIRMPDPNKADFLEAETPLEMLCMILGRVGKSGMKVDNLGSEIVKQTGVSWNKRFRANYGPLIKFIRRHENILGYNPDSHWIWLLDVDENAVDTVMKQNSESQPIVSNKASVKETQEDSAPLCSQSGWFDFNDSRLAPIHVSAIESQFEGRESAYILTYRLRSLDLKRDPAEKITPPEWVIKEIIQQNEVMRKEREEYDSRIHRISINLLESRHTRIVRGELEFVDDIHDEPRQLRIDCRKPLRELLDLIVTDPELSSVSHLWRGTECAYYIKDELKECDSDRPLNSIGITNGTKVLLWNGKDLNGIPWPHCHERPFRLLLECPICSPDMTIRIHGIATPLWLCISEHWADLDPSGVQISKVCYNEAGDECIIPLLPEDKGRTAEELGLAGDVHLVVNDARSSSQRAIVTPKAHNAQHHVGYQAAVKNCLSKEDNVPRMYVPLAANVTVREFRKEALRCCGFNAVDVLAAETRLRLANKGHDDAEELGPPLIDEWLVTETGWNITNDTTFFVLERGEPVSEGSLYLTIVPWDLSAECSVVVPETVSVENLKASSAEALLLKKDISLNDLFLQHVSWCDYTGTSYKEEEKSLKEAGIRHGDRLMLQRRQSLPKGQVSFDVVWRQIEPKAILSSATSQRLMTGDSLVDRLAEGLRTMLTGPTESGEQSESISGARQMGKWTVEQLTSISELRTRAVEALTAIEVPVTDDCIRLRVMERGRPSAVLKSQVQTVQRARLGDQRPLCVDILPTPIVMESGDFLLMIKLLDEASHTYSQALEMVWRPQEGALPSQLYAQIDAMFSLGVENFRLAKQLPERHQWMPIPPEDSTATGGGSGDRKKRTSGALKKISLLKAPYGLRDGDSIGLKRLSQPSATITGEDFTSSEDLEARKKLEEDILERRKKRQSNSGPSVGILDCGSSGGGKSRPFEAPLVIHVQRFT